MCGVIGLILGDWETETEHNIAAANLHEALYYLQHRGQDACGIATCSMGGRIYQCKGVGMCSQVFSPDGKKVLGLPGFMGLGHLVSVYRNLLVIHVSLANIDSTAVSHRGLECMLPSTPFLYGPITLWDLAIPRVAWLITFR